MTQKYSEPPSIQDDPDYQESLLKTAEIEDELHLNECAVAALFVSRYSSQYCYSDKIGWGAWNGRHWDFGGRKTYFTDLITLSKYYKDLSLLVKDKDTRKALVAFSNKVASTRTAQAVLTQCENDPKIYIHTNRLDFDINLINLGNLIMNTQTSETMPHAPEHLLTKITNAHYDPFAECPRWLQFIEEVTCGDKDLGRFLQKCLGYSITGSTKEQKLFILYGGGANGKTVLVEVIREILGDYASKTDIDLILLKANGDPAGNGMLARLQGTRFAIASEPSQGARFSEGKVKEITGGETITARYLYKETFEYKPQFKLWITTNVKPAIKGTDQGIWRRIIFIPFLAKFTPEQIDNELASKLLQERDGILNWLVEGAKMWLKEGLLPLPKIVSDAYNEYRESQDIIGTFLKDSCDFGDDLIVGSKRLFEMYKEWCIQQGEHARSHGKFSEEIAKRFEKDRKSSGHVFYGIGEKLQNINDLF